MRSTGFTPSQVRALRERDGNRCAWTGRESDRLIPQHRANRGMGGSKARNRLSNGVLLDSLINGLIESDPEMAQEARDRGIKISQHDDPRYVPVAYPHGSAWLTDDGRRIWIDPTPF